jgi:exodeoxyribonuclease VII large subunit
MFEEDEYIFSIQEINHKSNSMLGEHFGTLKVRGEISNFSRPASGHMYFSLKDSKAQIRCAFFKGQHFGMQLKPENGMQVVAIARVGIYEGRGDYQLIVEHLIEDGQGALQQQFEALKKSLAAKGLFDAPHKKPIPEFMQTLGVITSDTGAAVEDVLSVLARRNPMMRVRIYPCHVQGDLAAPELTRAIAQANADGECDALLITRGGGSLEDLWAFNDERLVHAIFESTLPVVSAVGHEIDFTLCDFVADARAPTPSAGAEMLSLDQSGLRNVVASLGARAEQCIAQQLTHLGLHLQTLQAKVIHPADKLNQQAQQLDYFANRLHAAMQNTLQQQRHQLQTLTARAHALSPLATLSRGYSIATKADGHVVAHIADIAPNTEFTLKVQDGEIACKSL